MKHIQPYKALNEGKKSHGFEDYRYSDEVAYRAKRRKIIEREGVKYSSDLESGRDYVGDKRRDEILAIIAKELKTPKHLTVKIGQVLGLNNFGFSSADMNGHDLDNYNKADSHESGMKKVLGSSDDEGEINRRTVQAADFLSNAHVAKELKRYDKFCDDNKMNMYLSYTQVHTSNGKTGTMELNFRGKNWRDDDNPAFKVDVTFGKSGAEFHKLSNQVRKTPTDRAERKDVNSYKALVKFSEAFNTDHPGGGKIDEEWVKLKGDYDNYYKKDGAYSSIHRADANTIHFTAGNVGKKQQTHETVRAAAALTPPQRIGSYELVASDKVLSGSSMKSKAEVTKALLDQDNEYSEYENNVDFTYVYKK